MPLRVALILWLLLVLCPETALAVALHDAGVSDVAVGILVWCALAPLMFAGIFVVASAHDWWVR
jgi:hypothetical protein